MPSRRSTGGGFAPTTRSSASCARSGGARVSWARSLTVNPRSTSLPLGCATSPVRRGDQEISEHRVVEGPADERCHHRVSQGRVPLSQPKVRKILDTTWQKASLAHGARGSGVLSASFHQRKGSPSRRRAATSCVGCINPL